MSNVFVKDVGGENKEFQANVSAFLQLSKAENIFYDDGKNTKSELLNVKVNCQTSRRGKQIDKLFFK